MRRLAASIIAATAALAAATTAAPAWEPKGTVEFVVPYGAGGGSDINARVLVEAIRNNDLSSANIIVKNMPGGSGAAGNIYVANRPPTGATIMTFNSGQMMSTLANDADVKLENLTPLGTLALDTLLLVTPAGGEYGDFAALVEAAKANPNSVTVGGSARGSEDNMVFELANGAAGGALQYVPFEGGGQVLAALLGGHIKAGVFNPSEVSAQVEAGELRAIGSFSDKRLDGIYAETPTFAELGYPDAKFVMFRGYAGPANMDPEAIAYWEGVFGKAADTPEWREYIANNGLIPTYMNAAESAKFFSEENARYQELLKNMGFME